MTIPFQPGTKVVHGGITWIWIANTPCTEYPLLGLIFFDGHWRNSDGHAIVRVFPPRGPEWRDKDGRQRPDWHVCVHEREDWMPYVDEMLSAELNSPDVVFTLAGVYAEVE